MRALPIGDVVARQRHGIDLFRHLHLEDDMAAAAEGDLGAGKTALARGILQALGVTEAVPSPSFTLVQIYDTARFTVFHYDLYRIENTDELRELALEDALSDGVALIEWPERLEQ